MDKPPDAMERDVDDWTHESKDNATLAITGHGLSSVVSSGLKPNLASYYSDRALY